MTPYDPVEQEEALRAWWQRHGKHVLTGIALALAVIVGGQWWLEQQRVKRENAAILYTQMMDHLEQDFAQAQSLAGKLMEEYGDTPYAVFAALAVARLEAEEDKLDEAAQRLHWALERAGFLTGGEDLVRLRLARVQMARGQPDQALVTLGQVQEATFNGLAAALRGDIYVRQGQLDRARTAYRTALADPAVGGQQRALLQMKLDEIGAGEDAG